MPTDPASSVAKERLDQLHKRAWLARLSVPTHERAFAEAVLDWMAEVEKQLREPSADATPPLPARVWTTAELSAIAACPEPFWHETHRYCPRCPWTEEFNGGD